MSSQPKSPCTPEQYLELERKAEYRSEYYAGETFAMAGATRAHILITGNIAREVSLALRDRPCEVYANEMRVQIGRSRAYVYPDLVVACGEPQFTDSFLDTLTNPILIIEVLSKSTEGYDRGFKSEQYRTIDSLREYALVSTAKEHIELYTRQEDGRWLLSEVSGRDSEVRFASIGCVLKLGSAYEKVDLTKSG
jgi:Uma2 family endonuclease